MRRDPRKLLSDAIASGERIEDWMAPMSYAQFAKDRLLQAAVEREFEIVGEALNRLARNFPDVAAKIPELRSVVGFRNMLSHGYDMIDQRVVWSLAQLE